LSNLFKEILLPIKRTVIIQLRKGTALRKHRLHMKITASAELKLFISGNKKDATPLMPFIGQGR